MRSGTVGSGRYYFSHSGARCTDTKFRNFEEYSIGITGVFGRMLRRTVKGTASVNTAVSTLKI